MSDDSKWYQDFTENVHYRVRSFKHPTGRIMEEWISSNGDRWYLAPGISLSTFLRGHDIRQCGPVPGLLSK